MGKRGVITKYLLVILMMKTQMLTTSHCFSCNLDIECMRPRETVGGGILGASGTKKEGNQTH